MSDYPPYSVLMSVYAKDEPEFLSEAIASMAAQSVPFNDMVIVCDGPLTVGLDEVLGSWSRRLGDRLVIHRLPENGGLGPALAAGLPLCECDIVARMDSDDMSREGRCELLLRAMVDRGLDVVGGSIEEFDKVPGDMGVIRRLPEDPQEVRQFAVRRNPLNHMSVMYRRHVIDAVGSYEPFHLLEDYWLWVRVIMGGGTCGNIPDVVVDVRTGSGMYARRSNLAYLRSQMRFFSELRRIGFISRRQEIRAVAERSLAAVMPTGLLKLLYNNLLRVNSDVGNEG